MHSLAIHDIAATMTAIFNYDDCRTLRVLTPFSLRADLQAFRSREANLLEKKADVPKSNEEPSTNGEMPVVKVL